MQEESSADDIVFVFTSSLIYVCSLNLNFRTIIELQTAKVQEKHRNDENSRLTFRVVFDSVHTCMVGFKSLSV